MDPDARLFAVCFLVLLPLFWAPLFVTKILPGLDLPFHLALADMLEKRGSATSPYAAFYGGNLRVAPYAAHYMALVGLGKVLNLLTAHKVIVAAYIAGMPLSTASLLAACGRSRIPALLAFPLAYNLTLHYGFISFALSLPVLMLLLARIALHTQAESGAVCRTWLWAAALAFLLFLCHLQNFLYGACAALVFAVLVRASWRRRLLAVASLIPALAGLAYWKVFGPPPVATGRPNYTLVQAWNILKLERLKDLGRKTLREEYFERMAGVRVQALRGFTDWVDEKHCQILIRTIEGYVALGLLVWLVYQVWRRVRRPGPMEQAPVPPGRTRWVAPIVTFLGALAAYLLLPHHLRPFDLMTFYPRFAALVLLIALLLVPASLRRIGGKLRLLLPLPAMIVCALYGVQLVRHYKLYAAEISDFLYVVSETPPGGKAVGFVFDRASHVMRIESAMLGLVDFYPVLRPGPGSMAPLQYCGMSHIPCQKKPAAADFPDPWGPLAAQPAQFVPIFDYYFVRSPPPKSDLFKEYQKDVELVAARGTWSVFRKKH